MPIRASRKRARFKPFQGQLALCEKKCNIMWDPKKGKWEEV
jgi:hypothetical protein